MPVLRLPRQRRGCPAMAGFAVGRLRLRPWRLGSEALRLLQHWSKQERQRRNYANHLVRHIFYCFDMVGDPSEGLFYLVSGGGARFDWFYGFGAHLQ